LAGVSRGHDGRIDAAQGGSAAHPDRRRIHWATGLSALALVILPLPFLLSSGISALTPVLAGTAIGSAGFRAEKGAGRDYARGAFLIGTASTAWFVGSMVGLFPVP